MHEPHHERRPFWYLGRRRRTVEAEIDEELALHLEMRARELIEQGVPVDSVFILLDGRLAVWLRPRHGPEREIARLNAGEIVGEMSFVDARPPSATVRAAL